MKFTWTEKYSVGVGEIDDQHRHFFEISNNLFDLCDTGAPREELLIAISRFNDYAFYHLDTEEEYFYKFDYADKDTHISTHKEYREKTRSLLDAAESKDSDINAIAKEVSAFSNEWLSNHILIMDQKYSSVFKEHGLR